MLNPAQVAPGQATGEKVLLRTLLDFLSVILDIQSTCQLPQARIIQVSGQASSTRSADA